jgi:hypothetical protein
MIADKIDKLLQADKFTALNNIPVGKMKKVELTFAHVPDAKEFVEQSNLEGARGLYARTVWRFWQEAVPFPAPCPTPFMCGLLEINWRLYS